METNKIDNWTENKEKPDAFEHNTVRSKKKNPNQTLSMHRDQKSNMAGKLLDKNKNALRISAAVTHGHAFAF